MAPGEGKLTSHSEKPKWRADLWQCETQSAPARGGSRETGGSGADGADPDDEEEGPEPPLAGRGDRKTKAGAAKTEPLESAAADLGEDLLDKAERREGISLQIIPGLDQRIHRCRLRVRHRGKINLKAMVDGGGE